MPELEHASHGGHVYRIGSLLDDKGIASGNFLVIGKDQSLALAAASAGAAAVAGRKGVVTGFSGGVGAKGFKLRARSYRFLMPASTRYLLCPALTGKIPEPELPQDVGLIYEIVINGMDDVSVKSVVKAGNVAAAGTKSIIFIGASNFDGKLEQSVCQSMSCSGDNTKSGAD